MLILSNGRSLCMNAIFLFSQKSPFYPNIHIEQISCMWANMMGI